MSQGFCRGHKLNCLQGMAIEPNVKGKINKVCLYGLYACSTVVYAFKWNTVFDINIKS